MKVKIKVDGKQIEVDCTSKNCPKYTCFGYHRFSYYHTEEDGIHSSWHDDHYSCPHRNYHGCPEHPRRLKEEK